MRENSLNTSISPTKTKFKTILSLFVAANYTQEEKEAFVHKCKNSEVKLYYWKAEGFMRPEGLHLFSIISLKNKCAKEILGEPKLNRTTSFFIESEKPGDKSLFIQFTELFILEADYNLLLEEARNRRLGLIYKNTSDKSEINIPSSKSQVEVGKKKLEVSSCRGHKSLSQANDLTEMLNFLKSLYSKYKKRSFISDYGTTRKIFDLLMLVMFKPKEAVCTLNCKAVDLTASPEFKKFQKEYRYLEDKKKLCGWTNKFLKVCVQSWIDNETKPSTIQSNLI